MSWKEFRDPQKKFSVVLFVEEEVFNRRKKEIEDLGNQRNVKMVVQPCAFEGIEFLYRLSSDFLGKVSMDKEFFWQALALKGEIPQDVWKEISKHQYEYLCAILEQDTSKVQSAGDSLRSLSSYFL